MVQGRRQYTDEFKREAVALLASSDRPLLQIANELGISPSMLRNWRNRSEGRRIVPPKLDLEPALCLLVALVCEAAHAIEHLLR